MPFPPVRIGKIRRNPKAEASGRLGAEAAKAKAAELRYGGIGVATTG